MKPEVVDEDDNEGDEEDVEMDESAEVSNVTSYQGPPN